MKAIMVMFDSLNRRYLPNYGCDWTHAPNFQRLGDRAVTFDRAYVGSMPCMPARRELHTGRYNFLHRTWGPLEPFDDSMPELLKEKGVYTHLVSDHYHYLEDGGATYHQRYSSYEMVRGQEGDPWKGHVPAPGDDDHVDHPGAPSQRQDTINRSYMKELGDFPQAQTFAHAEHFLRTNHQADNWFLHVETFDPHEPFFSHPDFHGFYPDDYRGPRFDWPGYCKVTESDDKIRHLRHNYAALLSMCDHFLGRILDMMDEYEMWDDTLLIVNTDHGYLLGEHGWWAKCVMPFWNEVAHMPLFIWDPRCGCRGERRQSLVQTIDLPATLLDYFGLQVPPDMQGVPLRETIAGDVPVRQAGLFGIFGAHVNVTDGRHVYMRAPAGDRNGPMYEYTVMPTQHGKGRAFIPLDRLRHATMAPPFTFTKGCPLMKLPGQGKWATHEYGTLLYDLDRDPAQQQPIEDAAIEQKMLTHLVDLMSANDCPPEQYTRLGLPQPEQDGG